MKPHFSCFGQAMAVTALTLLFGTASPAHASTLDQSQTELDGNTSIFPDEPLGQTFTVGTAGVLDSVEVLLADYGLGSDDFIFEIRSTVGGIPDDTPSGLLFSQAIPITSLPDDDDIWTNTLDKFTTVDVSSAGIAVVPGDVLAIVMRSDVPFAVLVSIESSYPAGGELTYSNGIWYESSTWDLGFRTYVAVPEPASLALLGLTSVMCLHRRQK